MATYMQGKTVSRTGKETKIFCYLRYSLLEKVYTGNRLLESIRTHFSCGGFDILEAVVIKISSSGT
jgi:hypothetical protein